MTDLDKKDPQPGSNSAEENPQQSTEQDNPFMTRRVTNQDGFSDAEQASDDEKPVNTISLYLPGLNEPLVITGKDSITFGRRDVQNGIIPTVDLSTNYGALLGVSRMHAEILFRDDGCFIEDLNSSNGTWVNERKIDPHDPFPLRNGDQVRLGQLLMIVYMSSLQQPARAVKTTQIKEAALQTLSLTDPGALHGERGYTVAYLREKIVPIIEAVEQLYKALLNDSDEMLVINVTFDKSTSYVLLTLSRGEQLVSYLRERLPELITQHGSGATAPLGSQLDIIVQDIIKTLNPQAEDIAVRTPVSTILDSSLRMVPGKSKDNADDAE